MKTYSFSMYWESFKWNNQGSEKQEATSFCSVWCNLINTFLVKLSDMRLCVWGGMVGWVWVWVCVPTHALHAVLNNDMKNKGEKQWHATISCLCTISGYYFDWHWHSLTWADNLLRHCPDISWRGPSSLKIKISSIEINPPKIKANILEWDRFCIL